MKPRHGALLLAAIAASSLGMFASSAGADTPSTTTTIPPYQTGRPDSGTPNSTIVVKGKTGEVISYGNTAIIYNSPYTQARLEGLTGKYTTQQSFEDYGAALYAQNCASCHGVEANGVPYPGTPGGYPNLRDVGAATVDFWIESGRMPAANPKAVQAIRMPQRLNRTQALAIAAWITSISTTQNIPYVPNVNLSTSDVSNGAFLFSLNCAACHTITGDGDALGYSTFAPSLRHVPGYQIAEAVRTGPGNMPRFTGNLSDKQVRDIVAYVTGYTQHPVNPGGLGLGGLGPVAEGFVALALGVGILALISFWVGDRQ